jgi:hypothetical protein
MVDSRIKAQKVRIIRAFAEQHRGLAGMTAMCAEEWQTNITNIMAVDEDLSFRFPRFASRQPLESTS